MSKPASETTTIDPTARIAEGARIGAGVSIGPYCIVGPNVELGEGCRLVSHVNVDGHTTIGAGTIVYPFAIILIALAIYGAIRPIPPAQAGEGPNIDRQIGNLARAIQELQDENREQQKQLDILKSLPAVKKQYETEEKRRRERRK